MTTDYTIYLVNKSVQTQTFWSFLAPPEVTQSPDVFANSSTNLAIPGLSTNLNSFTIPVQYLVGTGASNQAVGLNTLIQSNAVRDTDLDSLWDVEFASIPPRMGPIMPAGPSGKTSATTVGMKTNPYSQAKNQANQWFESMSFGIRTAQGFMGVTWDPGPNLTYEITPKLDFFINVGDFQSNQLASFTSVGNDAQELSVATSFDLNRVCTVVYLPNGTWETYAGPPKSQDLEQNAAARRELVGA